MSASAILRGGSIVINASDQWFVGKPHSFAYGMTKGALGQITRSSSAQICFPDARIHGGACLFDSIGHNQLPSIL